MDCQQLICSVRLQPILSFKLSKQVMDFFWFSFVFLVIHFLHSEAVGNEPVCSKFLYEEQLLGKMTRVEVQMDEWDKHLKMFEETVLSVLEHRREEMEKMVAKCKKIDKISEDFEKLRDAQNKKLEDMSLEQRKLSVDITNMTLERQNIPTIAFNAYSDVNGIYPENKILKFVHVLLNEGDGYDATSGYFTAPVTGLYQFTAHACNEGKYHMIFAIVHEESIIAVSSSYESSMVSCSSVGAMVHMQAGERVCVKSKYSNSHLYSNLHRRPSFMGVLLQRKI